MITSIRSAPNIILKILPQHGTEEKTVGYCTSLNLSANSSSRTIYGVDSPFAQEIAFGSTPMQVGLSMTIVMPKSFTLESLGLVPYRTGGGASANDPGSKASDVETVYIAGGDYLHIRLYDRSTGDMFYGVDYCKVQQFAISASAKSIITANLSFTGLYLIPGLG